MAEWLRRGLQILLSQFDSGRGLQDMLKWTKINKNSIRFKNFHSINNYTHTHKLKSKLCGDEIHVYLIVKNNKLMNFKYETKSCIYCQASASLLSRVAINKETKKIKDFI